MSTAVDTEIPRLKARYNDEIKAQLQKDLGIENVMQVPNLEKIVINMGVGRAAGQPSLIEGEPYRSKFRPGQKSGQTTERKGKQSSSRQWGTQGKLSAATGSHPIAPKTWLVFSVPEEQALPAETAMPAISKLISWLDAATPGIR